MSDGLTDSKFNYEKKAHFHLLAKLGISFYDKPKYCPICDIMTKSKLHFEIHAQEKAEELKIARLEKYGMVIK